MYMTASWLGLSRELLFQQYARALLEKGSQSTGCAGGRDGGLHQEGWVAALWRPGPGFLILELRADWFP